MNIFILEDDVHQQQRLKQAVEAICAEEKILIQHLTATAKPEVLLTETQVSSLHNLYFLDMEIDEQDRTGLEVAQQIREQDSFGTIVFITTHSEMAPLTFSYKVSALGFIEKDQDELTIRQEIKSCILLAAEHETKSVSEDALVLKNKFTNLQVPFSEIYYFETTGTSHKLRLVTSKKMIEFYGELKEIEEVDARLFRCHRAFVINLENVSTIDRSNKTAIFPSGDECAISRRLMKELLTKFNQ